MKRDSRYDILFEPIAIWPVKARPLLLGSALLCLRPVSRVWTDWAKERREGSGLRRVLPVSLARLRGVAVVA